MESKQFPRQMSREEWAEFKVEARLAFRKECEEHREEYLHDFRTASIGDDQPMVAEEPEEVLEL